jgi:hypothetical protein
MAGKGVGTVVLRGLVVPACQPYREIPGFRDGTTGQMPFVDEGSDSQNRTQGLGSEASVVAADWGNVHAPMGWFDEWQG